MSMLERWMPHPMLTVFLTLVWVMLMNDVSLGNVILGFGLAWAIAQFTSAYWPGRPRIRNPAMIIEYTLIVLWDIIVSNVQVAYLVLFRRGDSLKSMFITIPLEITSPEAITTLAGTITMTPGTVSADVSADGRALLVHCLETTDPDDTIATIKARYESRLLRIFQ